MVPAERLELSHLTVYAPKAYVYTNFTTRAYHYYNTKKPEGAASGFRLEILELHFLFLHYQRRRASGHESQHDCKWQQICRAGIWQILASCGRSRCFRRGFC